LKYYSIDMQQAISTIGMGWLVLSNCGIGFGVDTTELLLHCRLCASGATDGTLSL
jgi:hypothetical protein